jgi:flagellar basal-body rod modification protein FlgD
MSQTTTFPITGSAPAAGSSTTASSNPLASLTGNFQDFLSLLTTQLQNQDPSSPMDSNQFTTELVQFAGVEQQIETNSSLSQLIQLTQGSAVMQSAQLLGKQVAVNANELTLQNGTAAIDFTASVAGPVAIAVYGPNGQPLYSTTVQAAVGSNTWTWNGETASGAMAPDGVYKVAVATAGSGGMSGALPFTVLGKVTGVQQTGSNVQVNLGQLSVGISALASVGN